MIQLASVTLPFLSYYGTRNARELCHRIKESNGFDKAVLTMAKHILSWNIINANSILIPAPQHTGQAVYTLFVAQEIASRTGAIIWDNISRTPGKTLYEQKIQQQGKPSAGLFLKNKYTVLPKGNLFFIDNVLSSGTTYMETASLLPRHLIPLPYAIDISKTSPTILQHICKLWHQLKR